VGDRRLDRDLGEVAQDALVSSAMAVARRQPGAASGSVHASVSSRGELDRPPDRLHDPAHALRVGVDDLDRPELVERALRGHRRRVDALADERDVAGDAERRRRG
jgi:hypothetical protein